MENREKVIGIVGAGVMGTGVAQRYAAHGYEVVLLDTSEKILNTICELIDEFNILKSRGGFPEITIISNRNTFMKNKEKK